MKQRKKTLLVICVVLLSTVFTAYIFSPLSIRLKMRGLNGTVLYEYSYSNTGTALILRDEQNETISFVDINEIGVLAVIGVRAYAIYCVETGEIEKIAGFDDYKKQYGFLTEYRDLKLQISIQIPQNENGVPDLHLFKYGICKKEKKGDVWFQNKIGEYYVFAEYVSDF